MKSQLLLEQARQAGPEVVKALAAALLREIPPYQPLGTELYNALLLHAPIGTSVEAVCLCLKVKEILVYLTQRAADDTAYANQYHCPGTFVRKGEDYADSLRRLTQKECGARLTTWRFINTVNHPQEERGHCISTVFLCTIEESVEGGKGNWFPINGLPHPVVESHQKRIIPAALGVFVAEHPQICS